MVDEEKITGNAVAFARRNKKRIARERTDPRRYEPEERPISIFMAGSPGAGKTEIAKEYVAALDELKAEGIDGLGNILRIDPDDLREELPGYTGNNSWLFPRCRVDSGGENPRPHAEAAAVVHFGRHSGELRYR